jgi:hypothetical protein
MVLIKKSTADIPVGLSSENFHMEFLSLVALIVKVSAI